MVEHSKWLWRCGAAGGVAIVAALVLGLGGTASAVEPGVHVDPGSPAGKEYAIPLDQARNDALPPGGGHAGGGGGAPGSGASPLFGAGVVSRRSSGSAGVRSRGDSSRNAVKQAAAGRGAGPALPAAASTGAGADTSPAVLIAIAVLAAGCLSGLAVRRLGRHRA